MVPVRPGRTRDTAKARVRGHKWRVRGELESQPTNDPFSKTTAADLGAWLVFEDESGQGLRPPKGRTWGRRGRTPVVRVTAANHPRLSLAALVATRPGQRPRLIYRTHRGRRGGREGRRKG